jgi:multiple sugar transport system substrate-binding protein
MRWLAIGTAVLTLAAACSSSAPSTPSTSITFWYLPNGTQPDQHFQDAAKAFHAAHPDIEVTGTKISAGDAYNKMFSALTGGAGPDVMQVNTNWVGAFAGTLGLHEFSADEIQGLGGKDAFVPAAWTTSGTYHSGKTTAIPWFIDTRALYYRPDVLQGLGIDPATAFASWGALEQTLNAVRDSGKIQPLGVGRNDANFDQDFASWVWEAGGSFTSEDGTKPTIGQPLSVNGVDEYQRVAAKYTDPKVLQQNTSAVEAMFAAGKFAVTFSGPWLAQQLHGNFGVAPFPPGPVGHIVYVGGANLSILKTSKHEAAAYEWVRWLASNQGENSYVQRIGMYPALAAAAPAGAFKAQINSGRSFPTVPAWPRIENAMVPAFSKIWDDIIGGGEPMPKDQLQTLLEKTATDMQAALQT